MTKAPKMAARFPFDRLYTLAEVAALPTRQRNKYERSLMNYWDMLAVKETERNARKREKAESRAEGRAEGHAEGKEEGLKEARKEAYEEKLENVRSLKALGTLTNKQIAEIFHLSEKEVENV